jgi:hypothetical protein
VSTTKVILAGALGAVVVGAVIVVRNRAQQAQQQGSNFCASVAQPLGRLVGFDIPPSMCGAVNGLIDPAVKVGKTIIAPFISPFVPDKAKDWDDIVADARAHARSECAAQGMAMAEDHRVTLDIDEWRALPDFDEDPTQKDRIAYLARRFSCAKASTAPVVVTKGTQTGSDGANPNDPSTWPPGYRWNGSHWERIRSAT